MSPKRFQLRGAEEMARVLRRMPRAVAQDQVEKAMLFAARPVRDEAKRLVRVDQGDLRDSIKLSRSKRGPRRRLRLAGVIFLGFEQPFSRIAHLIEFGSRHARAFPFVRPALDSQAKLYFERLGQQLGRNIERTAAELAGPFRKIRRSTRRRL
jgi:HK97 gp10 family phage protein